MTDQTPDTETKNTAEELPPESVPTPDIGDTAAEIENALTQTTEELPPDEDPGTLKLGDHYDECLLGSTIKGNYAYSLKRLVEFEVRHRGVSPDEARNVLGIEMVSLVRKYGSRAPEFIDDEHMVEQPRIALPTDKPENPVIPIK